MLRLPKTNWSIVALFALMLGFSFSAAAQRVDGNIGGRTTPGDTIAISNPDIGFKRETTADDEGEYRFRSVPLGKYLLVISRGGSDVFKAQLAVRPGVTTRVPTPDSNTAGAVQPDGSAPAQ